MRHFPALVVLFASTIGFAQQPSPTQEPPQQATPPQQQASPSEVQTYAPYSIALLPAAPGGEVVLPFITTDNKLAFFTASHVQQASAERRLLGRPISYGELLALLGGLQIEVDRLRQENDKLWAVVTKSSGPQTVVVQPSPAPPQPQGPTEAELRQRTELQNRQLMLMYLLGQQPQRLNMNVNVRDCTRYPVLCVH
jgi:hypothetical protein